MTPPRESLMAALYEQAARLSLPLFLVLAACGSEGVDPLPEDPGVGRPPLELVEPENPIPGQYLFFFDEALVGERDVAKVAAELTARHGGLVSDLYEGSVRGFLGYRMDDATALAIAGDVRVQSVGQDGYVRLTATQTGATWGLDRIDERARALNARYEQTSTGQGVNVYVLDTGIRSTHVDFGGRVMPGFTAINDGKGTEDCNGHGTHVAGTIGGSKWGVAKGTRLYAVRVLGCTGGGAISGVIQGINWVTANHVKPAVVNMSLGGGAYGLMDDAIRRSIAAGVTYVLAAGNSDVDACTVSPARTPEALTVGASNNLDQRASFSNWGSCVDLFAPGVQITSPWYTGNDATKTISGTSMAAPHVAGVAALFLEKRPTAKQADVAKAILDGSTPNVVTDPKGSSNRLLYSLISPPPEGPPPPSTFVDTRLWTTDYNDVQGWGSAPKFWQTLQSGDLNGDGNQDMCGRAGNGVFCVLSTGVGFGPMTQWSSQFGDSLGWGADPKYWQTVKLADLNADGKADVCGRSGAGLVCALSTGTAFAPPALWTSEFSDSTFWASNPRYWQTLQFADVNGDKQADVCGRGTDGAYCALSTGTGFSAATLWGYGYADATGWGQQAHHWQTLRFPDLNGDGLADVCGRGGDGMVCGLSDGTRFGSLSFWTRSFSNSTYWEDDPKYWQTLQYVDLNGDKRADLCGRGTDGVYCMLSTGSAFGQFFRWTTDYGDNSGWGQAYHWQTLRFPDINGDGKADVCGRGGNGVLCALSTGTTFGTVTEWTARYNNSEGWTQGPQYYGTTHYLDLNKDGRADICMRSKEGLVCSLVTPPPNPPRPPGFHDMSYWSRDYNDVQGWGSAPKFWQTLQSGDLNGDGFQDMCGRAGNGMFCVLSTGAGFGAMTQWSSQFGDSLGWGADPKYWQTVKLADLNADGKTDVCGRSDSGMVCALSTGTAFDTPALWTSEFSDSTFWGSDPRYWQTLQFADINGDKRADLCGRGTDGAYCALSTGTGFSAATLWGYGYADATGWGQQAHHWQTLRFPDLNGDGSADVCGRAGDGIVCGLSNGSRFGSLSLWTPSFSNATYWKDDPKYWQTLQYVDVNGDSRADLCGRGTDGVYCTLSTGTAFTDYKRWSVGFGDDNNWGSTPAYWQTLRFPDVNGDGKADVCGRGTSALFCAVSDGTTFGESTAWSISYPDEHGWNSSPGYWGTFHYLDLNKDGKADVCARGAGGLICGIASN
ncbi:S8 family serine peptidase [Hyalangium rubrum]|uniref:S8 family serine peptidase n=1 Tax=Hyalangium rubrum TaxID=3103134 RepID=A0ABU5HE11_9BACT|nr:S8 family serine peptidase [Hyalangium sp. s54d21]MDY7230335.1 S8 family serine peptidase [Hyalangium sp. s54d21]